MATRLNWEKANRRSQPRNIPDKKSYAVLPLRWASSCAGCGLSLPAGTGAYWNKDTKQTLCGPCGRKHYRNK